jgi:hypothetical protein
MVADLDRIMLDPSCSRMNLPMRAATDKDGVSTVNAHVGFR